MYYTYVLISKRDNKFYIGYSSDLKNRIQEHTDGKVKSTRNRRPLQLIYYEACVNKYDAIEREKYFKMGFGRRFLHNRMKNHLKAQARDGGQGIKAIRREGKKKIKMLVSGKSVFKIRDIIVKKARGCKR
jgi:putative endonuclease